MTEVQVRQDVTGAVEAAIIQGDLSKLSAEQRVEYYRRVCDSLGLNYWTQPFGYIVLNNRLTLYAKKDAADQLRKRHGVSIGKPDIRIEDDWIIVTVTARDSDGREDSDVGAVSRKDMRGDFGNALMKAVTKAKRRVTLSLVGLGWLDETEVETIPDARIIAEPEPETPKADSNGRTPLPEGKPHWIENPKVRAAFWAYTGGDKGLSNSQVYKALGVESIHDYRYTMQDAKADIERWLDEQATQAADDEQAEPEPVEG